MRSSTHTAIAAVIAAAALWVLPVQAQTYPSKPITMIVPYAAGGSVDAVARLVSDRMAAKLGGQHRHRECGRRWRRDRHRARRACGAGRLHAAVLGREHDRDCEARVADDRAI